jgi:hypothetical protein
VNAIAVGSWQWSCTADCAGATCMLGPGAADSHSRARSWPCDVVVRCRPLPMGGQRQLRSAAALRYGRLHRLRQSGACRQRDAPRGDRQLGVPVEDHETVCPPADPPLSSLRPPSHAFKRPVWYFASNAQCSQGPRPLPRSSRDCAADDLRADRAHVPVRPTRGRARRRCGDAARARGCTLAARSVWPLPAAAPSLCAHQAWIPVRPAAARVVFRPTRACE